MTEPHIEELAFEDVQRIKYELWSTPTLSVFESADPAVRIVAEGDSWFDYPLGLDILDNLKRQYGYEIFKVAEAGDTLENMVYGTEYGDNFSRKTPAIRATLSAISEYKPRVFLFSGGGNDIAGPELESLLNHKDSGLPALRQEYVEFIYNVVAKQAYSRLIREVTKAHSGIHIITHGYAHPIPDGRGYKRLLRTWSGPWLRPALTKKNIVVARESREVMRTLIDRFNRMLAELDAEHENFHYIDLRPHVLDVDWENELHLRNHAYLRVAERFHNKIQELLVAA
jgi:lysophospholipase L1-like esterase